MLPSSPILHLLSLPLILPATLAWEAGFWATDGRNVQAHGDISGLLICHELTANPPLHLGQVTFDAKARGSWPYPDTIDVFSKPGCDLSDLIYEGRSDRKGHNTFYPSVAKSYQVWQDREFSLFLRWSQTICLTWEYVG
jgi:hypothetical protein